MFQTNSQSKTQKNISPFDSLYESPQKIDERSRLKVPQGNLFFLDNVSVNFGNIHALRSIQLGIDQGEVVFLTGVSGAGKSTLLRVLSGDVLPTSGRVIGPKNSTDRNSSFVAEVFQDLRLIERLTCEDNLKVAFDPSIYRTENEFQNDLYELSKVMGIYDRLNMKMHDANGGLKQKVAIIRALLTRPTVLVADEPTSALDYDSTKKIFDVLSVYNMKKGLSVVWASHNRELVKRFTGRIIHLENGRLVYAGHACFI